MRLQDRGYSQESFAVECSLDLTYMGGTEKQQYDVNASINEVRNQVERWRALPPSQWQLMPETARLLQHWRHHHFKSVRPFLLPG